MAFQNLDVTNDSYHLYLDNQTSEMELDEDSHSTASEFEVLIEPQLDLGPLLFLKSTEGEVAVQNWHIDSMPLTVSRLEKCYVTLIMDKTIAHANMTYGAANVLKFNNLRKSIALTDHHCKNPEELVNFFNLVFEQKINQYVIGSYLKLFLDTDVWDFTSDGLMNLEDTKIINRYLDIGMECRNILHHYLCELSNVESEINFQEPTRNDNISKNKEDELLKESKVFKERSTRKQHRTTTVPLDKYQTIDLSKENPSRTEQAKKIKSTVLTWLSSLRISIVDGKVEEAHTEQVKQIIESNKRMVELGLKIKSLISLERDRIDGRTKKKSGLFLQDLLSAKLDVSGTRITFDLNPKQFLHSESKIAVFLPEIFSYALGASANVVIGPIGHEMKLSQKPRLTNNILSPSQQLFSPLRCMPTQVRKNHIEFFFTLDSFSSHYVDRLTTDLLLTFQIHLATDLAAAKGRDFWLNQTRFADYQVIYTYSVDEQMLRSASIVTSQCDGEFVRLKQINRVLDLIRFCVLDQNFKKIHFPQRAFNRIALKIRPMPLA